MAIIDSVRSEFDYEMQQTRKALERVPAEKFDYKPHEKSMSLVQLAGHIAEIPGWLAMTIQTDELVMSMGDYKPFVPKSTQELVEYFDKQVAEGRQAMENVSDETLMKNWRMEWDGNEIMNSPKIAVIRSFCLSHLYHHRGQLTVYLRLNDIPVPAIYGPSADEQ